MKVFAKGPGLFPKHTLILHAELDSGIVNDIKYKFYESGNYYSFTGEFVIDIDLKCLTDISFNIEHKRNYNRGVSSIKLIKSGENHYIVKYIIEKLLIVKNTSFWMLSIQPDKNMISYKMLSNKSNLKLYDVVKSSQGYYTFTKTENGYKVTYFQETNLESGFLMKPYKSLAKKEAIKFMSAYKDYLKNTCKPHR